MDAQWWLPLLSGGRWHGWLGPPQRR